MSTNLGYGKKESSTVPTRLHLKTDNSDELDTSSPVTGTRVGAEKMLMDVNMMGASQVPPFDEIIITYRTTGNGIGEIDQVVWRLNTITNATATLTYDASDRLSNVSWVIP